MKSTLIAATLALSCATASAQFRSAGEVLFNMSQPPSPQFVDSMGYVAGLWDAAVGFLICAPQGTTLAMAMNTAKRALVNSKEGPYAPAAPIIMRGLVAAYPCKQS